MIIFPICLTFINIFLTCYVINKFYPKNNQRKTLQDLSDDELRLVASAFIHDLTQEIEKREANERGEMQEGKKPFEEFNGKE